MKFDEFEKMIEGVDSKIVEKEIPYPMLVMTVVALVDENKRMREEIAELDKHTNIMAKNFLILESQVKASAKLLDTLGRKEVAKNIKKELKHMTKEEYIADSLKKADKVFGDNTKEKKGYEEFLRGLVDGI